MEYTQADVQCIERHRHFLNGGAVFFEAGVLRPVKFCFRATRTTRGAMGLGVGISEPSSQFLKTETVMTKQQIHELRLILEAAEGLIEEREMPTPVHAT